MNLKRQWERWEEGRPPRLASNGVLGLVGNVVMAMLLTLVAATTATAVEGPFVDAQTQGSWINQYGTCSYVLAGSQAEVNCQMPVLQPNANPPCTGETCPNGPGTSLTCKLGNPPTPGNFVNWTGGATNSLMDCAKTGVGQSPGANIKYSVRRCNFRSDAAGSSAQGWVWGSTSPANPFDPQGCMTNNPQALKLPLDGSCQPPVKPMGQNCQNILPAPFGSVASTWDDAMELSGANGDGGAELCVDLDFSDVPERPTAPYKLSAYFLDYDQQGRKENVSLYQCASGSPTGNCEDIGTLIAGPTLVQGFQQGKYLSWVFQGPSMALPDKLTIRVSRVQSLNAVLSGLFLDRTDSATCAVEPKVDIKKFTNGYDGNFANGLPKDGTGSFQPDDDLVAQVKPGGNLTWTYKVTNTGAEALTDVVVTDNRGVTVSCPKTTLAVGEKMECTATGTAADLKSPPEAMGCGADTDAKRPTYINVGRVEAKGESSGKTVFDTDPSAYCNPPKVKIVKFTNGHDGDTANGVPDPNPGSFSVGSGTVAEIAPNGAITWTYRVTNTGPEPLINVDVTDDRLVPVSCPKTTLAVGESMDCTAPGTAQTLVNGPPNVQGCGSGGNATRPTYKNKGTVTAEGKVSGTPVQDANPSHYCNPPPPPACNLKLDKTCEVVQPPTTDWASCKGKLKSFSLIWPSNAGTINISGIANDAPGGVVNPGQRVTFADTWSTNDLFLNITGAVSGQSTFHVSCSDADMDGRTSTNSEQSQLPGKAQDCGKFEGNGKNAQSGLINTWLLDGLMDANGQLLNCTPATTPPTSSCQFDAQDPPQCGTGGTSTKPSTLTFRYTGGGCGTLSNPQSGKANCSGAIDPTKPVNVTFPGGSANNVPPGGSFTIPRTQSQSEIRLSNSGGTEIDSIHTSCSQPLVTGDQFFSLTLVAMDGIGMGKEVKYSYAVTNNGAVSLTDITVTDDKLGNLPGSPIASLTAGETKTLSATAFIDKTTTNIAQAYDDKTCAKGDVTATATVTVNPPPPCSVNQSFYSLSDDKIAYNLTNTGNKVATLDTLVLDFPSARGAIKEVKLGGDRIYQADKSSLVVTPNVMIKSTDWTNSDVAKRQIKAGETDKLEISFTSKSKSSNSDFSGTATFQEGCDVDLSP